MESFAGREVIGAITIGHVICSVKLNVVLAISILVEDENLVCIAGILQEPSSIDKRIAPSPKEQYTARNNHQNCPNRDRASLYATATKAMDPGHLARGTLKRCTLCMQNATHESRFVSCLIPEQSCQSMGMSSVV